MDAAKESGHRARLSRWPKGVELRGRDASASPLHRFRQAEAVVR